ncbi:MAG: hypothetical protein IJ325_09185 [Clostridia bacterium]|nr:hypothetical protein [Clostridia bacterium]
MGKVNCRNCEKETDGDLECCKFCGCPLCSEYEQKIVRIKIPGDITTGLSRLLFSTDVEITDRTDTILWMGRQGEDAGFFVKEPTRITIHLGGIAKPVDGIVRPGKRYCLSQVGGIHLRPVYALCEIPLE